MRRERPSEYRLDVQGLRSIAIVAVLLFHLWPDAFPGGYVGVDVFFVISGYLISGSLLRELDRTGSIEFTRFYLRRAARLLPAALVVLCCVLIALPLLPEPRWGETAREIAASALYVQNWYLVVLSVDYLGAENAASPLRHFWSLAVEEQFYLFWPIYLVLCSVFVRTFSPAYRQRYLVLALVLVGFLSFLHSLVLTDQNRQMAYFSTFTRVWEFVAGALLVVGFVPEPARWVAISGRIAGFLLISGSVLLMNAETAFPGYAAAAPVLGTVLLLWVGSSKRVSYESSVLRSSPAVALGNISYSVYLWHWPLIIWYQSTGAGRLTLIEGLVLGFVSILLAVVSHRFIEERFRLDGTQAVSGRKLTLAAFASVTLALVALTLEFNWRGSESPADLVVGNLQASKNMRDPSTVVPSLLAARADLPAVYGIGCHAAKEAIEPSGCSFGDPNSDQVLALVGDSHAANWVPALRRLAEERRWHLRVYTKSACPFILQPIRLRGTFYEECLDWNRGLLRTLTALSPDVVFTSQSTATRMQASGGAGPHQNVAIALRSTWQQLLNSVPALVVIRDTPRMPFDPPECLAAGGSCEAPISAAMTDSDPIVLAATSAKAGLQLLDMTRFFCNEELCYSLADNVLMWRDYHHVTATYSRLLAVQFAELPAIKRLTSTSRQ